MSQYRMSKKVKRRPSAEASSDAKAKAEITSGADVEAKSVAGQLFILKALVLENGNSPIEAWIKGIRDTQTRQRIQARLDRIERGNLGEYRNIGEGVSEFKMDFGAGYRIYFARTGATLIVLLVGGDKSTQDNDIKTARQLWKDYRDDTERH